MSRLIDLKEVADKINLSYRQVRDTLQHQPDFPPPTINVSPKSRRWLEKDIDLFIEMKAEEEGVNKWRRIHAGA